MFTLIQCTPTRGDCTAGYKVDLDKGYTLTYKAIHGSDDKIPSKD